MRVHPDCVNTNTNAEICPGDFGEGCAGLVALTFFDRPALCHGEDAEASNEGAAGLSVDITYASTEEAADYISI